MKNILRFWPMWILYLAVLFFSLPVSLYLRTNPAAAACGESGGGAAEGSCHLCQLGHHSEFRLYFCDGHRAGTADFQLSVFGQELQTCIRISIVSRKELFVTGYLNALLFLWCRRC